MALDILGSSSCPFVECGFKKPLSITIGDSGLLRTQGIRKALSTFLAALGENGAADCTQTASCDPKT